MTITTGVRLAGAGDAVYEVGETAWASPWHEFVRARKVFRNFRYPAAALDQAGRDEWLDVLIRRPIGLAESGDAARSIEREKVFTIPAAPWLLEPLDAIDPEDGETGPLLVLADPHAEPLSASPPRDVEELERRVRLACEVLDMLEAFHERSLVAGRLDPDDFLVDGTGRWFYTGTDRVREAGASAGFGSDLAEWARLAARIVGGIDRLEGPDASRDGRVLADWIRLCCADGRKCVATVDELRTGRGLLGLLRRRRTP